jgi:hypothetical protein
MIAGFIIVHWLRSHAVLNSQIEWHQSLGIKKCEYFIMLKHGLSNPRLLFPMVMRIAPFHWHYYRTYSDTFPLNDSPVLITEPTVMMALSPRLMLRIDRTRKQAESSISFSNYVPSEIMDEFRRSTIANTYREIIFSSSALLDDWKDSPEFLGRHEMMKSAHQYNLLVAQEGNRELWNINAFANR